MRKPTLWSVKTRYLCSLLFISTTHAASIVAVVPSSSSPIAISPTGFTYVSYTAKNNTSKTLSGLTIDPKYGAGSKPLNVYLSSNSCTNTILTPGASCTFIVAIQGVNQDTELTLMPRTCAYNGTVCSIPLLTNRINVVATKRLPSSTFPVPYAGTFYPIYNAGAGQWLPPNQSPIPPFKRVSAIFVAFAHAYPQQKGAIFDFEKGQPAEPQRLALLVQSARAANPNLKIIISLGWGKKDWTYISNDYQNQANIFVPSVIQFIRTNHLDGLDIDDESIGSSSGFISQAYFDGVIANLRNALNYASLQDNKPYYLTITPAGNNTVPGGLDGTQVDKQNAKSFDLINIQSYFDEEFAKDFLHSLIKIGYPKQQIANGIDTQKSCSPVYPSYISLAGLFNWNMTQDSICANYANTEIIANLVGYYGGLLRY